MFHLLIFLFIYFFFFFFFCAFKNYFVTALGCTLGVEGIINFYFIFMIFSLYYWDLFHAKEKSHYGALLGNDEDKNEKFIRELLKENPKRC